MRQGQAIVGRGAPSARGRRPSLEEIRAQNRERAAAAGLVVPANVMSVEFTPDPKADPKDVQAQIAELRGKGVTVHVRGAK